MSETERYREDLMSDMVDLYIAQGIDAELSRFDSMTIDQLEKVLVELERKSVSR